jgi:hypothetical protein
MSITKKELSKLVRESIKEAKIKANYYSVYSCCRSCFQAEHDEDIIFLSYCNSGNNRGTLKDFENKYVWYIYYSEEIGLEKIQTFCRLLDRELDNRAVVIEPESLNRSIMIIRKLRE